MQKYKTMGRNILMNMSGSASAEYFINNLMYALSSSKDVFTIIRKVQLDYNLKILMIIYIKSSQPSLCKQKVWLLCINVIYDLYYWFPCNIFLLFLIVVHIFFALDWPCKVKSDNQLTIFCHLFSCSCYIFLSIHHFMVSIFSYPCSYSNFVLYFYIYFYIYIYIYF